MKMYIKDWVKRNPDKHKISETKSREKRKTQRNIEARRWRQQHPDEVKKQWVMWRINNAEYLREYRKKYAEKYPEVVRARKHARRIKEKSLPSKINPDYVKFLIVYQNMICNYCGIIMVDYQIDHMLPISRGGDNSDSNLQLICPTCNRKKSSKTDSEFKEYLNATA
jgi:5-methylcytosine-specific restriction endonuclease McrA